MYLALLAVAGTASVVLGTFAWRRRRHPGFEYLAVMQFAMAWLIGDAVLLASPDPPAGLDLAQRIIAACTAKDQYLQTRTALHHGPATQRGDDFFGATVNLTARLCAHAAAGQ